MSFLKNNGSLSELSSETKSETFILLLLLLLLLLGRRCRKRGVDDPRIHKGNAVLVVVMVCVVVVVVVVVVVAEKTLVEVERRIGSRQVESSGRSGSRGSFL